MLKNSTPPLAHIVSQTLSFDFKLLHSGIEENDANKKLTSFDRFVFNYVFEGEGEYVVNDRTHHIGKGDVFVIFPETLFQQKRIADVPTYKYYYVALYGTACNALFAKAGFSIDTPVIRADTDFIQNKMREIHELLSTDTFYSIAKANCCFIEVLCHLFGLRQENRTKTAPAILQTLNRVQFYISSNYNANITISDLSRKFKINSGYLTTCFKQVYKVSLKEYLMIYRLNKAAFLLANTDDDIKNIAEDVGFNDYTCFYKAFSKRFSVSPFQYRTEYKKK